MAHDASEEGIIEALLARHGRTYADEIGIDLSRETPSALYQWLCACTLLAARIRSQHAVRAARALIEQGWTTAERMAATSWAERTHVLNRSGYARYDESTSRMLGATATMLIDQYGGDLRRLRAAAKRDPDAERVLLKECKGIGDVGVDIFFREMQTLWPELYPFVGQRDLMASQRLGLGKEAARLAGYVLRDDFPRLTAALVRVSLAKDYDAVRAEAASIKPKLASRAVHGRRPGDRLRRSIGETRARPPTRSTTIKEESDRDHSP